MASCLSTQGLSSMGDSCAFVRLCDANTGSKEPLRTWRKGDQNKGKNQQQQKQQSWALVGSPPGAVSRCHTGSKEFLQTLLEISELILLAFRHKTKLPSVNSNCSLAHGELEFSMANNTTVLFGLELWKNAELNYTFMDL